MVRWATRLETTTTPRFRIARPAFQGTAQVVKAEPEPPPSHEHTPESATTRGIEAGLHWATGSGDVKGARTQ